ncbi:MAG: virulence-associated E family protein [Bacteroidota bacterium]|nr:virulence-associated E family protein [Bacteroidota bacterium]
MKEVTIITGKHASGKTTLARKMTENLNAVEILKPDYQSIKSAMEDEPDVIILEDATRETIKEIYMYAQKQSFTYRPAYAREMITKPFPKVICCTQQSINKQNKFPGAEFINL